MTGFSKAEAKDKGYIVNVEIKSLNGRFLDINSKLHRNIAHKEFEIRDIIKKSISRGSVSVNVTIDFDETVQPFDINIDSAKQYFNSLLKLKNKLKMKGDVTVDNLLHFANGFIVKSETEDAEIEWKITKDALSRALNALDNMRRNEGQQIVKDISGRMKKVASVLEKVDSLGLDKIPQERERLRMRVAQLFESDEIDEHRLQMELVLLADKLDFSEECVRMRSHIKFFNEAIKEKTPDSIGKKINFLLQEMGREVNTIGSKCNDAEIAQQVVYMKEELERIREQIQNIE